MTDDDDTTTARKVVHDLREICRHLEHYEDVTDEQKQELERIRQAEHIGTLDVDYIAAIMKRVIP